MPYYSANAQDRKGNAMGHATVTVGRADAGTVALYSNALRTVSQTNPITTDENGLYAFYARPGLYTFTITKTGFDTQTFLAEIGVEGMESVKNFGAKGDGVTDDGPALQGALDWLKTRGGGTLWLPFGKYITNQRLKYQNTDTKLQIIGEGRGNPAVAWTATSGSLIVGQTSGILLDASGCNGLTLQDVGLFSGTTNPSVIGVHLQRTSVNQFCAYLQTLRAAISMATSPASNGAVGSIAIMNKRGEHHSHKDSWFAADRPVICDGNSLYSAILSPDYAESVPAGGTLSVNVFDNCGYLAFSGNCMEWISTSRMEARGGYMLIYTGKYGIQLTTFNANPSFRGLVLETSAGTPLAFMRITGSAVNLETNVTNNNITNMTAVRLGPAATILGWNMEMAGVFQKIVDTTTETGGAIFGARGTYNTGDGHLITDGTFYGSFPQDITAAGTDAMLDIREPGGITFSTVFHTGGLQPAAAITGTDTTPSVTETYIAEVSIRSTKRLTGIALLNGSAVVGNIKLALADRTGAIVASTASVAQTGPAAYQQVPFSAAYLAKGPGTYFVLLQNNNTGNRFRSHTIGNFGASKKTGETYGTFTTISAPTTFTTNLGPIADVY